MLAPSCRCAGSLMSVCRLPHVATPCYEYSTVRALYIPQSQQKSPFTNFHQHILDASFRSSFFAISSIAGHDFGYRHYMLHCMCVCDIKNASATISASARKHDHYDDDITIMACIMTAPEQNSNNNLESYIERMHKCSAAQWEKRLESKDRDYLRTKLNKNKAGVVNTGSSKGFEPFKFSRRQHRRPVTKANSCSENSMMLILKTGDNESFKVARIPSAGACGDFGDL